MSKVSTLRQIKSQDSKPDHLRVALAAAIAEAAKADSKVSAQREPIERAKAMISAAEVRLKAARAAVANARAEHARRIADAASGGTPMLAASAMRAARSVQSDAEDDLVAAQDALAQLEVADLAELEAAKARADHAVAGCINAVLADEARRMIVDAQALKTQLFEKIAVLKYLARDRDAVFERGAPDAGSSVRRMRDLDARTAPLAGLPDTVDRLAFNMLINDQHPAVQQWSAARLALRRDPDAALPTD